MTWLDRMVKAYPTYRLLGEATGISPMRLYKMLHKSRSLWTKTDNKAWFKLMVLFS